MHRSALAKFRLGVAPIRLETSRYEGLAEEERVCPLCQNGTENEEHVLLNCPYYNDIRDDMFEMIVSNDDSFEDLLPCDKFIFILSHPLYLKICAKTCDLILQKRRELLYVEQR